MGSRVQASALLSLPVTAEQSLSRFVWANLKVKMLCAKHHTVIDLFDLK